MPAGACLAEHRSTTPGNLHAPPQPTDPVGTPRRVDSYPAVFHAFAYEELLDQNAGYWLDRV
jgi:hypothetical protein